jgi:hypothetical protein
VPAAKWWICQLHSPRAVTYQSSFLLTHFTPSQAKNTCSEKACVRTSLGYHRCSSLSLFTLFIAQKLSMLVLLFLNFKMWCYFPWPPVLPPSTYYPSLPCLVPWEGDLGQCGQDLCWPVSSAMEGGWGHPPRATQPLAHIASLLAHSLCWDPTFAAPGQGGFNDSITVSLLLQSRGWLRLLQWSHTEYVPYTCPYSKMSFFLFWWDWGLNSGLHIAKQAL